MITFERSTDYRLIKRILTHPKIYPHISDDQSPPVGRYEPVRNDAIWYVVPRSGAIPLGIWMFVPQNGVCWEVHTALLPEAWGGIGLEAARILPTWIWANTTCRRIITTVPSTNRLALRFALRAGMKMYGVNEASYMKGGKLCDQVCLGLSPPPAIIGGDWDETVTWTGFEKVEVT